ncbi:MAG: NACHT domain-containing protein, partial [Cyanobacteria bacterium P01_A01_bin.37]
MQSLPPAFLEQIASTYELSQEQTEALVKRLSDDASELLDAEALHISVTALRNRMSGVYTKFSISGKGPGKFRKLHDFLIGKYRETQSNSPEQNTSTDLAADINALIQEIREKVRKDVSTRCGTMRVLDMEQPIGIGDIYTNVNILEKLSGHRRLGIEELWQDCNIDNFDRFTLGQVRQERVPALDAVERYDKLMILGKPGAGKTTFMKRLAILCNQGEFQAHRIPVFVTLKEFAEAKGQPDLQDYIAKQWRDCKINNSEWLPQVLGTGRALILLDGLDEVQAAEHDRVLQTIKEATQNFRDCQFVMTCRIAAREYTFQQFTEVEMADFSKKQIAEFTTKWFAAKQDPKKSETFLKRLEDNEPIQELATSPLLLTLLCLVFGDAADFPANRSELYKEGLDVLLKKWDAKRNIERDQVYKKLSLKRKEDLLSRLAFVTFERGDYFFKQQVVEQHIIDYIRNLPGANENQDSLQVDGEDVLKAIEAQHGLLVERARGIYSFSHLTFQEYFTA